MIKSKEYYTTIKFNDLCFNSCHSPLCDLKQYNLCKKESQCLIQLCGDEERKIANFPLFKKYNEQDIEFMDEEVEKWRKDKFKKCKKIKFVIEGAK